MAKSIIFMCIYFISECCFAQSLAKETDLKFTKFLNDFVINKEYETRYFRFRALSVRESGECDGTPLSCPKIRFYLAISTFDEDAEQAVYQLPLAHDWKLMKLSNIDSYGEYQRYIVLTFIKEVPSKDFPTSWWAEEKYEVKINPWKSFIKRIEK